LFPDVPAPGSVPSCAEAGVLGVLPGVVGSLQAAEALKLLLGAGDALVGRMITYDALRSRFREVRIRKDPGCPICGNSPTIHDVEKIEEACDMSSESDPSYTITVQELQQRIEAGNAPEILDVRLPEEIRVAALPGACTNIPLHLVPDRLDELDPRREYAVLCHFGVRSRSAVEILLERGFENPRNILGGIDRWSTVIDSSLPRY